MRRLCGILLPVLWLLLWSLPGIAATASPLFERGFAVVPEPQSVDLRPGDFAIDSSWTLLLPPQVQRDSSAVEELVDGVRQRFGFTLQFGAGDHPVIEFNLQPGGVHPSGVQALNQTGAAEQAYKLELDPKRIRIQANSEIGLFYGAGTLVQLLRKGRLPCGEIADWPLLPQRHIYWDDSHHMENLDALKDAVREASLFKINGFVIKLDGHFEYRSAPAVVEPEALTPAQLQELTDYGLRFHVQVIPYLDAPAHISFILKHPEYAGLRAFPGSNYEMCATNPDSIKLLHSMYGDLLDANRGVKFFYLSTDEAYYVGLAHNRQCDEQQRAAELGSRGKLWAEFLAQAASFLHAKGREVVFWGEYPLKPDDISALPSYLINGEISGDNADPLYARRGIRQMIYEPAEGDEPLFPHYSLLPPQARLHAMQEDFERVPAAIRDMNQNTPRVESNLMGTVVAGWGDMGLHPETFWLGYATIAAQGWKPWTAPAAEAMAAFHLVQYGEGARNMGRVYQLLSLQAEVWTDTWDDQESATRPEIWGDSNTIYPHRHPAHDQTLPLPPVPTGALDYVTHWRSQNDRRLLLASKASVENDALQSLIEENLLHADYHRYDLEVFASIARLCRQNLDLLQYLNGIDESLSQASSAARQNQAATALEAADRALAEARQIRTERNSALNSTVATWRKTWMPRVAEANGRQFLHSVDDVKDHLPDRTVDMSYLVYRELLLPFEDWYRRVEAARNHYAVAHHLPETHTALNWQDLGN